MTLPVPTSEAQYGYVVGRAGGGEAVRWRRLAEHLLIVGRRGDRHGDAGADPLHQRCGYSRTGAERHRVRPRLTSS